MKCDCGVEHPVHLRPKRPNVTGELVLVAGGKRAYLWFGDEKGNCAGTISGPATLRAIAKAILEEVGA